MGGLLLASVGVGELRAGEDHSGDDQFWIDAAALLPGFSGQPAPPAPSDQGGEWGPVLDWPHVPVSAATLPNGKLMTYSGQERLNWPGTATQTYTAVWDPVAGAFDEDLYLDHEMFCAHLVMRTDGVLQTVGGRYTIEHSSVFDFRTNRWQRVGDLNDRRWYPTAVALPGGDVFVVTGNGGQNTAERYDPDADRWDRLTGIDWSPVAGAAGFESRWWPYLFVAPDGRMFHFGPTNQLHWVSAEGTGSRVSTSLYAPGAHYPKHAGVAMYDSGKILVAGGASGPFEHVSTNLCYTVDLNTDPPTVQLVSPMAHARRFSSAVVLPGGEVMIIGGNTTGQKFSDNGSVLPTEIWDPATDQWRETAPITVPRNYHSVGLLLADGRVFSGGGGFGGNGLASWNHKDAQVYTPPQLFSASGAPAERPVIDAAPESVAAGSVFGVEATPGLHRFAAVRMMATTHGLSTDQRRLDLPFAEDGEGDYRLLAHPNPNVMIPGYWMLFAIDGDGVYSEAAIVHIKEAQVGSENGLRGEYHDGTALANPRATRIDPVVDFAFGPSSPVPDRVGDDSFSARWTGWVIPEQTQTYTFYANADDGVRLWVDGMLLIDDWTGGGGTIERSGQIALAGGEPVAIQLEYFEATGTATIELRWSSPGTTKAVIPERCLRHVAPTGTASVAVDDVHELYIDGELVGIGTEGDKVYRHAFEAGSKTTVAMRACELGGGGFAIGEFVLGGLPMVTDTTWKVSTAEQPGWNEAGFDDSSWANATDHGGVPDAIGGLSAGTVARQIWAAEPAEGEVFLRVTVGAPEIDPIPDRVELTGEAVDFTPAFSAGGTGLVFSATDLPPGVSIDPDTGAITGTLSAEGVFEPVVTLTDSDGDGDAESFRWVVRLPGQGEGSLLREWWTGIPGSTVAELSADPRFPHSPTGWELVGEFPVGEDSGDLYGSRLRGYLHAPVTGDYQFWVNGDDGVKFLLGTGPSPGSAVEIASVPGSGSTGIAEWDKFPEQQSAPVALVGGQTYYFEILHKEGTGSDHVSAAWRRPGDTGIEVIAAAYLSPFNRDPALAPIADRAQTAAGGVSFYASALDPDGDPTTFSATGLPPGVSFSPAGLFSGTATTVGSFNVTVQVTDSRGGGDALSFTWTVNPQATVDPFATAAGEAGSPIAFGANASGGTELRYSWDFGDGTPPSPPAASSAIAHTFAGPGRYAVALTVSDLGGGEDVVVNAFQNVRPTALAGTQRVSQSIVTTGDGRVWNANPDNGTVAVLDPATLTKLAEIPVGAEPRCLAVAPDGDVWVVAKAAAAIDVIDATTMSVTRSLVLPRASGPHGLVFDIPSGHAYVTLEALGQVAKLDAASGAVLGTLDVGDWPRGLALGPGGEELLVSRFISPPVPAEHTVAPDLTEGGGQVLQVSTATFAPIGVVTLQNSVEPDSGGGGRGVPNYLGAAAVSPAGDMAWIPSKQDNVFRGLLRDGRGLTHDTTVRAISSMVDLATGAEVYSARVDHDDAAMPSAALFSKGGLYVFVALEGSREVAVIDAYGKQELFRFDAARAPQGLALSPDGSRLYVHNFMGRSVSAFDITALVGEGTASVTPLGEVPVVGDESLSAEVLQGKRLFYDARSDRLSRADYMSCASCHNGGGHDGRVWDLGGFGEGLRNTIDLRGRGGMAHGPLHWSANFDEVQDFENQIRDLAEGTGLLAGGSPHAPLGAANAGRSADLDALAAYVASLDVFAASPARGADGSMTTEAVAGRQIFVEKNCASCHSGSNFTDSGAGLHDIGTLTEASGARLGGALGGLDTPTLRGLYGGAPFLHDGSAATLADAVAAHAGVSLDPAAMAKLVAYLEQIGPDEPAAPEPAAPGSGQFAASWGEWLAGGWGASPAATLADDADLDGGSALLEYSRGETDRSGVRGPGGLAIRFESGAPVAELVRPLVVGDLVYEVEVSTDRSGWGTAVAQGTPVDLGGGFGRWSFGGLVGTDLGYARLKVSHPHSGAVAYGAENAWYRTPLWRGYSSLGVSVVKKSTFAGAIAGTDSSGITFVGQEPPVLAGASYLEVVDGDHEGARFEVDPSASGGMRVALDLSSPRNTDPAPPGALAGARAIVRPHFTFGEILEHRRFVGSGDPAQADQVLFYKGGGYETYFALDAGPTYRYWTGVSDGEIADAGGRPVAPGEGLIVRREATGAVSLSIGLAGEVRGNAFRQPLVRGFNLVASGYPVASGPALRGMGIGEGFYGSADPASADQFHLLRNDAGTGLNGYDGFWLIDLGAGTGIRFWTPFDGLENVDDQLLFAPGRAFFLSREAAPLPAYRWGAP